MRLISETLRKLRIYEKEYRKGTLGRMIEGTEDILKEAADAIEKMSEKLKENNLNNAWILCSERLPETDKNRKYLVCGGGGAIYIAEFVCKTIDGNMSIGPWWSARGRYCPKPIAWQPLPEPYKE